MSGVVGYQHMFSSSLREERRPGLKTVEASRPDVLVPLA